MKTKPKNSAVLLRRSRRQPSFHGPTPGGRSWPSSSNGPDSDWEKVETAESTAGISEPYNERRTRRTGAFETAPALTIIRLFQLERGEVPAVDRLLDRRGVVHPIGHEERERLVPEHAQIGLLRHVLIDRLPLLDNLAGQLRRRHRAELRDRGVDLRIVGLSEVLVVCGLDRLPVNQQVEVDRVREVRVPVRKTG